MQRPLLQLSLVLTSTLLVPRTVLADDRPSAYPPCQEKPTQNDIDAAKGAYFAGKVSLEEADYERAILYWEDAFRRQCTATRLLLSLARAYELSEDRKSALDALQTYLERRSNAKDRKSVEKRIVWLKKMIAENNARIEANALKPEKEAPPPKKKDEVVPDSTPAQQVGKPIWPIFMTGGGVALAVAGHIVIGHGSRTAANLGCNLETNICPGDEATKEASDARKKGQMIGIPMAVTGYALGAVGGVLWYYLWIHSTEAKGTAFAPSNALLPVVTHTYQGLNFSTTF